MKYKRNHWIRNQRFSLCDKAVMMAHVNYLIVLAICLAMMILEAEAVGQSKIPRCRRTRGSFTYKVNNQLHPPFFSESQKLCIKRRLKLIDYMERAVIQEPAKFKNFTATFSSPYGFFINSINGVTGKYKIDGTFWIILNTTDKPIEVGVSSYVPRRDEVITFNFTNFWPGPPHV